MSEPTIEARLTDLEKKVARLMNEPAHANGTEPWWQKHVGAFKDDPLYDEAMWLGAEYRKA